MGTHLTEMQQLGARLRDLRVSMDLSQPRLERATGIDQRIISQIERGERKTITPDEVRCLALALGEDPYYLFTGERQHALGPVAGRVHEIESRTELDWYARDAIVAVAEREAQRVRDQQRDSDGVMARLLEAGFDREAAARAVLAMLSTDGESDVA